MSARIKVVMAELLFAILILAAITAGVYDFSVGVQSNVTISAAVNWSIYEYPIIAYLAGGLTILFMILISRLWNIRFRYVLAIMILGIVFGHLFWGQKQTLVGPSNQPEAVKDVSP